MRIVGGRWAGRTLVSPGGRVRPTAEALRTAMLEMIADDVNGARVLDLFAGTGALGLEALSRGGRYCDFVENGPAALHSLKANVAALRLKNKARIYDRDAIPFVERLQADRYDIAFADPPYGSRKLDRVIAWWRNVPFSRILVLEHAPDHQGIPRGTRQRFGDSAITVLRARGLPDISTT
jgi:16S rRNA (guanine966-N2)-methyltransferase